MTQLSPEPEDVFERGETAGCDVHVSEVQCQQNHISKVVASHPLLQIVLDCLKDEECRCPSALELFERIELLKECSEKEREAKEKVGAQLENSAEEILLAETQKAEDIERLQETILSLTIEWKEIVEKNDKEKKKRSF